MDEWMMERSGSKVGGWVARCMDGEERMSKGRQHGQKKKKESFISSICDAQTCHQMSV